MRHAYLISGPPSIGKTTLAKALAMALNCTAEENRPCGQCRACTLIHKGRHPDLTIVESENVGSTLKIEQIREMQHLIALRPYEARYRVAIIRRFHEASNTAPDALLKTLEEPPANVVLILTTEDASRLLATIRSRCQPYYLQPLRVNQVYQALEQRFQGDSDQARLLAHLSGGRIGWAINAMQEEGFLRQRDEAISLLENLLAENRIKRFEKAEQLVKNKPLLLELLRIWQTYWRDVFLMANGSQEWIMNVDRAGFINGLIRQQPANVFQKALESTRQTLDYLHRNVNTRLAVEAMLLDYPFIQPAGN